MNSLLFLLLFTGHFSGTGEAVFASGKTYKCTEIFLNLKTKQEAFYLLEGGYNCGVLQASFDPFKMTIKDGILWNKEEQLGTISDSELDYKIFDPADGSTYHLNLKKTEENQIRYLEEWHDGEKIALKVSGNLL